MSVRTLPDAYFIYRICNLLKMSAHRMDVVQQEDGNLILAGHCDQGVHGSMDVFHEIFAALG
jgi:hypothetical protein